MVITELWMEHSQAQFPAGYGGKDVNEICVTSLCTNASGCISSYIKNSQKSIDIERYQILQKSQKDLENVLPFIEGDAFEYFSRLNEMCNIIIVEASIA